MNSRSLFVGTDLRSPRITTGGRAPAVSQQKLPQPMARAQLIFLRRLAGAYHVPQRLVRGVRDPHRRQVARAVAPCQFSGRRADPP